MKDHYYKTTAAAAVLLAILMLLASYMPAGVFADSNIPVTVGITVTYIVAGNPDVAGGDTVTLTADDPSSPMPGGAEEGKKTITISNEGTYSFGDIHFEKPGVHWYTITRNLTWKKGVAKDSSVYKAKVIALNDGHGYVLVFKSGSDEKTEAVYSDRVAPATGDTGWMMLYCGTTITTAAALAVLAALRSKHRGKEARNGLE